MSLLRCRPQALEFSLKGFLYILARNVETEKKGIIFAVAFSHSWYCR